MSATRQGRDPDVRPLGDAGRDGHHDQRVRLGTMVTPLPRRRRGSWRWRRSRSTTSRAGVPSSAWAQATRRRRAFSRRGDDDQRRPPGCSTRDSTWWPRSWRARRCRTPGRTTASTVSSCSDLAPAAAYADLLGGDWLIPGVRRRHAPLRRLLPLQGHPGRRARPAGDRGGRSRDARQRTRRRGSTSASEASCGDPIGARSDQLARRGGITWCASGWRRATRRRAPGRGQGAAAHLSRCRLVRGGGSVPFRTLHRDGQAACSRLPRRRPSARATATSAPSISSSACCALQTGWRPGSWPRWVSSWPPSERPSPGCWGEASGDRQADHTHVTGQEGDRARGRGGAPGRRRPRCTTHLLLGLLVEGEGLGAHALRDLGVTADGVREHARRLEEEGLTEPATPAAETGGRRSSRPVTELVAGDDERCGRGLVSAAVIADRSAPLAAASRPAEQLSGVAVALKALEQVASRPPPASTSVIPATSSVTGGWSACRQSRGRV